MKDIGRALGTLFTWAGVGALSWLFNSFGILTGDGAIGLVLVGLILSAWIWAR